MELKIEQQEVKHDWRIPLLINKLQKLSSLKKLNIKTFNGKTIEMNVQDTDTVHRVKLQIQGSEGILTEHMALKCADLELDET
jgi:hypothetical protein